MRAHQVTKALPGVVLGMALLAGCSTDADAPATTAPPSATASAAASESTIGDYLDPITVTAADPGPRPLLSWAPVDGASWYLVAVLDSSGVGYWTWEGAETEVHVGGTAEPDAIGPYVFEDMTWMVAAQDAEGTMLAVSEPSPLSP